MIGEEPSNFFYRHPKLTDAITYSTIVFGSLGLPGLLATAVPDSILKDFVHTDKQFTKIHPGSDGRTYSNMVGDWSHEISNGLISNEAGQYLFHSLLFLVPLAFLTKPTLYLAGNIVNRLKR